MKKSVLLILLVVGLLLQGQIALADAIPNYMPAYADRYQRYAEENPLINYAQVLVGVNLGLDQENYKNVVISEAPQSVTVFVSKHYGLPKGYKPENLVSVDKKYAQSGVRLREDCNTAMVSMAQAMEKEGLVLYIKSGYRTNRKRGGPDSLWYAWPNHTEHQTGLAFDLRKKNVTQKTLGGYHYEKTNEYAWLCEHAHEFGFVLSYPKEKTALTGFGFEPWHWRYVGVNVAADMRAKGFSTYQEYWATHLIQTMNKATEANAAPAAKAPTVMYGE